MCHTLSGFFYLMVNLYNHLKYAVSVNIIKDDKIKDGLCFFLKKN